MRILIAMAALIGASAGLAHAEDLTHCKAGQAALEKDLTTARTEFKLCLSKGALLPQSQAAVHMNLGLIAFNQKKYPEVISEYEAARKIFGAAKQPWQPSPGTLYTRGVAYAETGQLPKARADLDGAVKAAPKEMRFLISRLSLLIATNQLDGALADTQTLLTQPDDKLKVLAHARRMEIFERQRKFDDAFNETQEVLKLDPKNLEILISRVDLLDAMGKRDQVMADSEKLLKSDNPRLQYSARTIRGAMYDEGKQFDEALKEADAAIALDAKNPIGYNNKCMALANLGKNDDAIATCQKAMGIAPKSPLIWNSMGFAYEKAGKLTDALTYYQKVAVAEPKNEHNNADLKRVQDALTAQGVKVTPVAAPASTSKVTPGATPATGAPVIVVKPSGTTYTDEKKPAKKKP